MVFADNFVELYENYADPGDGSGVFMPVTSSKTVEFLNNGTFSSNGDMCFMSSDVGTPSSGDYSALNGTIAPINCVTTVLPISFEIINGELIVSYPCFEACKAKFELVP